MSRDLLAELERTFKRSSDGALDKEYRVLLEQLRSVKLTQELVDFLCAKIESKKHIWEIRFEHLRILLINPSAQEFALKDFYFEKIIKCRRLALKLFFIRGYAQYATEEELNPIMERFQKSLEKNHDYIDYNWILSVAGLPFLVSTYKYPCFLKTLKKAEAEHLRIDELLRGYFTLDENLNQVNLLSFEETEKRSRMFLEKLHAAGL